MSSQRIDVSPNREALAHRVAQWIVDLACHNPGRFSVCLSGGSTPRRLYQFLAATPLRDVMPWQRVHWFWGDERFVPWDHPDSNYGMAREAMLAHVPVPSDNIHGIAFDGTPADAARVYQDALQSYYGAERLDPARPLFDVVLLGMGPDGHTASLIPGEPVLDEKARWVAEVTHGRPEARITLTYPALDSSRSTAFVAAGRDKRTMMQRVLTGDRELPAARIRPIGELIWFIDNAAQGSQ
jgi:6-phosphogluconolactonase